MSKTLTVLLGEKSCEVIVKSQVEVFWVMTPCILVGYQRFEEPCCPHLQGEWGQQGSSKRWYRATTPHHTTRRNDLNLHRRENLKSLVMTKSRVSCFDREINKLHGVESFLKI